MDSPKHLDCTGKVTEGQFYRIAGTNSFKCKSCGVVKHKTDFEDIEFQWKTSNKDFEDWVKTNKKIKADKELGKVK